jgi:sarcosine oxidase subunit beta
MIPRHDVLIVGAGVIGCSVAFHLTRRGVRRVAIVEREPMPGTGSTSKANGGIRAQFTTTVNVAMSLRSMDILDALALEIGEPPIYRKAGYLFLTASPERLAAMERAVAFQRSLGVTVELLDRDAAIQLAPFVEGSDLVGGTFGARDGFIDPGALASFFLREATLTGVELVCGAGVVSIDRTPEGSFLVTTTAGKREAGVVVIAAGAWSAGVAAAAGVDVPVQPVRRHLLMTGPCPTLPPVIPMTIDADTGILIRREGDRVLVAYSNPDEPAGFVTGFDPSFPERIVEPFERRFPRVAAAGLDLRRGWAGLYEVTPDHHAIVGEVSGAPGFFLATGFSGHGIMHAPAAGEAVAEWITGGRATSVDISPLALERFARGATIHEMMVL